MGRHKRATWATGATAIVGLLVSVTGPGYAAGPGGGGAPDPSFGGDGVVDLPAATISAAAESTVSGVTEAPDGSIRVLWDRGGGSRVSKYSATGVLDTTFGAGGHADLPDEAAAPHPPAVDAVGATFVIQPGIGVRKLDPSGGPDPTFGEAGVAPVAGLSDDSEVHLRADGGVAVTAGGDLVALSADGSPDPDFTYDAAVYAQEVAVLADGRVAVAATTGYDLVVLDPDGSPATGIGPNPGAPGVLDIDVSPLPDRVATLAARPGGGLLALVGHATTSDDGLFAVMFTAAGARDMSFGENGVVDLMAVTDNQSLSIFDDRRPLVDATGRVVLSLPALVRKPEVVRLEADGDLDATFGTGGRRLIPTAIFGQPLHVSAAADGGLWLTSPPNLEVGWVARLTPDGADDPAFDDDGFLFPALMTTRLAETRGMVTQSDGSAIIVQGPASTSWWAGPQQLIRLTPSGAADLSFGTAGRALLLGREDAGDLARLTVDAMDRIYAIHQRSPDVWVVSRWLPDGDPDATWGDGGQASLPFIEALHPFWFAATPLADGTVMVAGSALWPLSCCGGEQIVTAVRLDASGGLDATYTAPEVVLADDESGALTFLADGSTIIGTGTTLQRFTPSGLPDPSWHTGPVGTGAECGVALLAPWRRGGVLVATLKECSTSDVPVLYALDAHGHPDPLIPDHLPLDVPAGSGLGSMVVDAEGRIVLGVFGAGPAAVRLLADGSRDPRFSTTIETGGPAVDRKSRVLIHDEATGPDRVTRLLAGSPPAPLPVTLPTTPLAVNGAYVTATGDFDGDGTEDILWYAPGTSADSIWYGRHAGGFTKRSVTINGVYRPVPGDFDGDGRTDLLFYAPGSGRDFLWRSLPSGGFASSPTSINGTYTPVPGDFDGDGQADIVWYAPGAGADFLWTARATGGFASSPLTIDGNHQLIAGDYSGDGRTDLLLYAAGVASDRLWTARPTGGFASSALTINGTYRPATGDFNGDGLDDVLWHGPGTAADSLWLSRRGGGFSFRPFAVAGSYVPVSADVTGDGLADILWYAPGTAPDHLAASAIP